MVDINKILEKTKLRAEKVKSNRKPPSIATDDRPYSPERPLKIIVEKAIELKIEPKCFNRTISQFEVESNIHEGEKTKHKVDTNLTQREHSVLLADTKYTQTASIENDSEANPLKHILDKALTISLPEDSFTEQLANNRETISKHNRETIGKQLVNDQEIGKTNKETISKPISKHNRETIGKQLVNQLVNSPDVSTLTGLQREILFYIVEDCIYRGRLMSGFITNQTLREITKANADTVKTTVQRLVTKGFINRNPDIRGKRGRGGFSTFTITEQIRDGVLKERRNPTISNQLVNQLVNGFSNQLVNNKETNKETSHPSSSIKLNTTTELGEEWNFDISPYSTILGFTSSHIKQLEKLRTVSASEVEQSLIEFSYDLANNALPPIRSTKINFLMGLLRNGQSYVSEGFRNDQETLVSEMARRAEAKRKKLQEEKFIVWLDALNDEQLQEIKTKMPTNLIVLHEAYGFENEEIRKWVFDYFLKTNNQPKG